MILIVLQCGTVWLLLSVGSVIKMIRTEAFAVEDLYVFCKILLCCFESTLVVNQEASFSACTCELAERKAFHQMFLRNLRICQDCRLREGGMSFCATKTILLVANAFCRWFKAWLYVRYFPSLVLCVHDIGLNDRLGVSVSAALHVKMFVTSHITTHPGTVLFSHVILNVEKIQLKKPVSRPQHLSPYYTCSRVAHFKTCLKTSSS